MLTTIALTATVMIPIGASVLLVIWPFSNERTIARISLGSTGLSALASAIAIIAWIMGGTLPYSTPKIDLISEGSYHFSFGLLIDGAAAIFLILVQFTSGTVMRFSRVYLHREAGFRRFFATALMFQGAMCLLTLAENLDLLFAGWEMVGLASFLLIAFYHERPSAVRNALKTYSIYRVADLGMLLGAYLQNTSGRTGVGILLLLAAIGKSAQFPFSFWIVRAMEGPTPSSALFYGGLSVHAGAYLLLRTYSLWGNVPLVCILIGVIGISTAILCTIFGRVQHTIKGQVGYASVTQVGLIFLELSCGFTKLALFHMVSNVALRCYQLLVSPSAVAYLLRQQSTVGSSNVTAVSEERFLTRRIFPKKLRASLYVFALSEGYLEEWIRRLFWMPLRSLYLRLISGRRQLHVLILSSTLVSLALLLSPFISQIKGSFPTIGLGYVIFLFAAVFSILGLGSWRFPIQSFLWIMGSSILTAIAVFISSPVKSAHPEIVYTGGVITAGLITLISTYFVLPKSEISKLYGLTNRNSAAGLFALTGVLGMIGFPIFPTFFGEDILLHAAFEVHRMFAVSISALFAFNGYLTMRTYAFAFFGKFQEAELKVSVASSAPGAPKAAYPV